MISSPGEGQDRGQGPRFPAGIKFRRISVVDPPPLPRGSTDGVAGCVIVSPDGEGSEPGFGLGESCVPGLRL